MQVQTHSNQGLNFGSLNRGSGVQKLSQKIAENPILFTADALDLGAGISTALGVSGAGAGAPHGTSFLMGAYHGAKAVVHLVKGATESDNGVTPEGKHQFTMMVGEALSATGQICALSGVGPVSLGFLGLGMLITNTAQLNH